jgi:hypothetical protein
MRSNIGRTTERFVRSRVNLCGYQVMVLSVSRGANRRSRLVREVYPEKHASPDWPQDAAIRHELEELYTEWGLDIGWLRGERSYVRAVPSRKKRRPRAKSRRVKQMPK